MRMLFFILLAYAAATELPYRVKDPPIMENLEFLYRTTAKVDQSNVLYGRQVVRVDSGYAVETTSGIYINTAGGRLLMKSPDGTCSECGPNNSDAWSCAGVTCP